MQQMEWRETLMEARAGNDLESLKNLDNEIRDEQEKLFCGLKQSFARQDYDTAAEQVRQGRFLDNLRNEISSAL